MDRREAEEGSAGDFLLGQSPDHASRGALDLVEAEPAPAFDFDQSGPEFEFDQLLPDPFDG